MNQLSGDEKGGKYSAVIPDKLVQEPGFKYKIRVIDYTGNIVETVEYFVSVEFGIEPDEYVTDFEERPLGWTLTGDWECGEPTEGIGPAPYTGNKLMGTKLDGNYSLDLDSILVTPPIDLRNETLNSASLRFYQWYDIEKKYDSGEICISNDYGENWNTIKKYDDEKKEWKEECIDLSQYIGSETPIYVAFRLSSDSSGNREGWYIDNVRLMGNDEEKPSQPTGLTGEFKANGVELNWDASQEVDVNKYRVYRSNTSEGEYNLLAEVNSAGYLDSTIESNNTYYYKVTAIDFSGNESDFSDPAEVKVGNINIIFHCNFEDDNGGFTSGGTNDSWEWGIPTSGPNGAFTGTKVWATSLSDKYYKGSNCWLESPEIQLTDDENIVLSFVHWYDMETGRYDTGQVEVSIDGENWNNITPSPGYISGHLCEWVNTEIPLDEYKGQNIKLRFKFKCDTSLVYDGWYIDNVSIASAQQPTVKINNNIESCEDYNISELKKNKLLKKEYKEYKEIDFNLNRSKNLVEYKEVPKELETIGLNRLPVDAVITVLETGKSVRTSLIDGRYSMMHPSNEEDEDWTLRAVSYGYYPQEKKVHLEDEQTVTCNFDLEPIPRGTITGRILDRISKEPVPNAKVVILEDTNIENGFTDEEGYFTISDVMEGTYTLAVYADAYYNKEAEIDVAGNQENEIEIGLKRFVGYSEELIYDDGSVENALVLNEPNNGLAVKMTPKDFGKLKGVNIYFYDETWPKPGGDEIGIAIFESDSEGNPGEMFGEPKYVTIERGDWNYIDISDMGFATDKDFYLGTMQDKIGDNCPGVGIDENGEHYGRSYLHVGGNFELLPDNYGNLMIRGIMEYSLDTPQITSLEELSYTNQDNIEVSGKTNRSCEVNIYVNKEKVAEVQSENGKFTQEVALPQMENEIYVTGVMEGKETEPSNTVKVIKDLTGPELNIETPQEGEKINEEIVHVKGNTTDEHFDKLLVNDKEVPVDEQGNFEEKVIVDKGENIINITSYDLAGNKIEIERKVYVKLDSPVIIDIKPDEDVVLVEGDELEVSFRSEITEGQAYFRIVLPTGSSENDANGLEMVEEEPGYYKGTWVVPEGIVLNDALIEIEIEDSFGNVLRETAPGTLTIEQKQETNPMSDLPSDTSIVGDEAFNSTFLENNEEAQQKVIQYTEEGLEVYCKVGEDLIIDSSGNKVDNDVLPESLIYYDEKGDTYIYMK